MVTASGVYRLLAAVRERGPLVQCITNSVVTGFTANALLALGAAPAMVDNLDEAPVFAGVADITYELDWSADLITWHFLDYVPGTGEAGTVVDPTATGHEPARFYRFITVEPARELPSD